jgi:hypothetical protein
MRVQPTKAKVNKAATRSVENVGTLKLQLAGKGLLFTSAGYLLCGARRDERLIAMCIDVPKGAPARRSLPMLRTNRQHQDGKDTSGKRRYRQGAMASP